MDNLRNIFKKINMKGQLDFNEPMSLHTTYKTGGPADIFCTPADTEEFVLILEAAENSGISHFILGGGANILVSDHGFRGIVIDTGNLNSINIGSDGQLICGSGTIVDRAAEFALKAGLQGFDSFYGMPGTVGGAVWMNARCYGRSISDIIADVTYLDEGHQLQTIKAEDINFGYKKTPFQELDCVILEASFLLEPGNPEDIKSNMMMNKSDRENKGHYSGPSAGSVFKNNRSFGKPSGAIIDSLNLRGTTVGGAKISEHHANIFINQKDATSSDILALIRLTQKKVMEAYGFALEPEVQLIGKFD